MRKFWRVYKVMLVSSIRRDMEFRANFWARVGQNVLWCTFYILVLVIIYRNTDSIAGWGAGDSYLLMATLLFLWAFLEAFVGESLMELPEKVRKGTLDYDVLKPIDAQFLISFRRFRLQSLGVLFSGVATLAVGLHLGGYSPSVLQWLNYGILTTCSVVIFYSFQFMMMTLSIWFVRVDNLWVLGESLFNVARFPLDVFGNPIRMFLTFVLPAAFIATIPARAVMAPLPLGWTAGAIAWACGFFLASRAFFAFAIRQYSSASS